ncbi:MFS transporter [Dactylosporangium sp. NPDC051485]|uniref:MFS transporter n=1 Tax=Dactylosporangium sp. NPDC051485 TaxID=3154846 RepID=UPI0034185DD8
MRDTTRMLGRNATLRRLLAALAVSQLGDWLYNLALLAFVYDRTHSVTWTAVTTAARALPMVLLGPFGGVLADRYDRRRLMIASDVLRAGTMVLLAVVAAAGLPVVLAPVLAAVSTAASAVYPPSVAATVPRIVDDADLPAANAVRSAIQSVSVIAGPAGGALLLLVGSPTWAFLLNAATFAGSALLLAGLVPGALFAPPASNAKAAGVLRELRTGLSALRADAVAGRIVGADIVCSLAYGALTVLLLLLSRRLGDGDAGYGYLLAGFGVGGLVGAAVAARLGVRNARYAVAGMLVVVAVPAALLSVAPSLVVGVALAVAFGAGTVMVEIVVDTALARRLDETVLARAYGLAYPASIGGVVAGSLIAAPLVGLFGLSGALAAVGVVVVAYAGWLALPAAQRQRAQPAEVAAPVGIGTI